MVNTWPMDVDGPDTDGHDADGPDSVEEMELPALVMMRLVQTLVATAVGFGVAGMLAFFGVVSGLGALVVLVLVAGGFLVLFVFPVQEHEHFGRAIRAAFALFWVVFLGGATAASLWLFGVVDSGALYPAAAVATTLWLAFFLVLGGRDVLTGEW